MLGKIGWIVLVVISGLLLLNHVVGVFVVATSADEARMFIGYAIINAFALLILFFAYRKHERWAWWSLWLAVLSIGVTVAYGADAIGWTYLGIAGVMALAQLATAREFFGAKG